MHINMNAVDTNPYKYAICTGSYLNNMKVHKHNFLTSIPNEAIALLSDCSIRVFVCWNFKPSARLACAWFLEITFMPPMCVCVCVCVHP